VYDLARRCKVTREPADGGYARAVWSPSGVYRDVLCARQLTAGSQARIFASDCLARSERLSVQAPEMELRKASHPRERCVSAKPGPPRRIVAVEHRGCAGPASATASRPPIHRAQTEYFSAVGHKHSTHTSSHRRPRPPAVGGRLEMVHHGPSASATIGPSWQDGDTVTVMGDLLRWCNSLSIASCDASLAKVPLRPLAKLLHDHTDTGIGTGGGGGGGGGGSGRPALIARLKQLGVEKLSDRQGIANALTRALREGLLDHAPGELPLDFEAAAAKMPQAARQLLLEGMDERTRSSESAKRDAGASLIAALRPCSRGADRPTHGSTGESDASGSAMPRCSRDDLLRVPAFLSSASCALLRAAVDARRSLAKDSVDLGAEHQLNLSRAELESILQAGEMAALLSLPSRLSARSEPPSRVEIFVRRYTRGTRPFIPFHCDKAAYTVNVACSDDALHEGGRLLCLLDGSLEELRRTEGEASVHPSSLLHAVSAMTSGVRYSLIVFFHGGDGGGGIGGSGGGGGSDADGDADGKVDRNGDGDASGTQQRAGGKLSCTPDKQAAHEAAKDSTHGHAEGRVQPFRAVYINLARRHERRQSCEALLSSAGLARVSARVDAIDGAELWRRGELRERCRGAVTERALSDGPMNDGWVMGGHVTPGGAALCASTLQILRRHAAPTDPAARSQLLLVLEDDAYPADGVDPSAVRELLAFFSGDVGGGFDEKRDGRLHELALELPWDMILLGSHPESEVIGRSTPLSPLPAKLGGGLCAVGDFWGAFAYVVRDARSAERIASAVFPCDYQLDSEFASAAANDKIHVLHLASPLLASPKSAPGATDIQRMDLESYMRETRQNLIAEGSMDRATAGTPWVRQMILQAYREQFGTGGG
jgi:hypothetical protein